MRPKLQLKLILLQAFSSLFCIRAWGNDLKNTKLALTKNFLTRPTYECFEINAHNLILLYRTLRDKQELQHFNNLVTFTSQPCEAYYRHARALSTSGSTVINFSMNGFLHNGRRIDLVSKIEHELNAKGCKYYFFQNNRLT